MFQIIFTIYTEPMHIIDDMGGSFKDYFITNLHNISKEFNEISS